MAKRLKPPTSPEGFVPVLPYRDTDEFSLVLCERVFLDLQQAEEARVVGQFLLGIGDGQFALASANILNGHWDWQYVGRSGKDWPAIFTQAVRQAGELVDLPPRRVAPPGDALPVTDIPFVDALMGIGIGRLLEAHELGILDQTEAPVCDLNTM